MHKINKKYLYDIEYSNKLIKQVEQKEYYSNIQLEINTYPNATILPSLFISWDSSPWCKGGVIDNNNVYIEKSAIKQLSYKDLSQAAYRMYGSYPLGGGEHAIRSPETVLYLGLYTEQWGHMITEWIARLWPLIYFPKRYKDIKIAYIPLLKTDTIYGQYLEILELIGIKEEQLIKIDNPMLFRNVIIPDPCIEACNFYTDEYRQLIEYIKQKALSQSNSPQKNFYNKIFLSHKTWYKSDTRDIGENVIEEFFNMNGYKSVSLENYSLIEQIKIINSAKNIAATISTLPHNIIWSNNQCQYTIINKMPKLNMIQFLIDDYCGNRTTYIDAYLTLFPTTHGLGPFLYDINQNIKQFASDNNMKIKEETNKKDKIIYYLDSFFSKNTELNQNDMELFRCLYKLLKDDFVLYSTNEILIKKYFHKLMYLISTEESKSLHKRKYQFYKNKYNSLKNKGK